MKNDAPTMEENSSSVAGYQSAQYAQSLAQLGTPLELPRSGGWLLVRPIPGSEHRDAMGCYPLFCCQNWDLLEADLKELDTSLVSVSLVADPFGNHNESLLKRCFPDKLVSYKQHYVTDLKRPLYDEVPKNHLRNSRKALQKLRVEVCAPADSALDDWISLYAVLIERHSITGQTRFSRRSFAAQLRVPGIVAFRCVSSRRTVGMSLWYTQGKIAYYHLGAYHEEGYEYRAAFGMFWTVISHFAQLGIEWLALGGGAGNNTDGSDGLSRFKLGWATGTRTAWLCGRIINYQAYEQILRHSGIAGEDYFPAYRDATLDSQGGLGPYKTNR
jgi:hypothetical protein